MIAHVWNEIEHDIGYKPELGAPSEDEAHHLAQLGRLVRQGDIAVSALLAANDKRASARTDEIPAEDAHPDFADVHDFVSRMKDFGGGIMPRFSEYSGQLFELLVDLNLANPKKLDEVFEDFDPQDASSKIRSFNISAGRSGLEALKLDGKSSDLLLIELLDRKRPEIVEELKGRAGRGRGRPSRLHRIAVRYHRNA